MYVPPLRPRQYATMQVIAAIGAIALILSVLPQLYIAFTVPGALMFVVTALLSLLMVLPLLLYLRASPPLTLDATGIALTPHIGRRVFIAWDAVREVKPYPLLPPADNETLRRAAVGRKKYSAAEGIMLTSDALPWTYRAVGWFAGEGFRGTFAITNRAHADYAQAKYLVEKHITRK